MRLFSLLMVFCASVCVADTVVVLKNSSATYMTAYLADAKGHKIDVPAIAPYGGKAEIHLGDHLQNPYRIEWIQLASQDATEGLCYGAGIFSIARRSVIDCWNYKAKGTCSYSGAPKNPPAFKSAP